MKIYLDTNVIADCIFDRDLEVKVKVESLRASGAQFPFSPAHLEEFAVIFREADESEADSLVARHVNFISDLSGNSGFMPGGKRGVVLRQEHPQECLDRVLAQYDLTYMAEACEEFVQSGRDEKSFKEFMAKVGMPNLEDMGVAPYEALQNRYGIDKREIGNTPPEEIFKKGSILSALTGEMRLGGLHDEAPLQYSNVKENFDKLQRYIDFLLRFMEKVGYRAEAAGRYRSRMHDVSHAIYATGAEILVIGDAKFRDKVKAVYGFLGVPVLVMSKAEFMAMPAGG
ncbi:hypothetical protein A167_01692 [Alcanivorax sp. S71-1-4]|uniref:hypothetical protein n=1 Tax=Alcanivorax sp. S71-1-4 TaxID=1177159 RepID=UPI001357ED28|nr:hypothetical protein [Alcanivorax sp. S71-1-4]KAF0809621.1 hypothetical protein A167_01692 [Alcanivorax sp. S71-1-4]